MPRDFTTTPAPCQASRPNTLAARRRPSSPVAPVVPVSGRATWRATPPPSPLLPLDSVALPVAMPAAAAPPDPAPSSCRPSIAPPPQPTHADTTAAVSGAPSPEATAPTPSPRLHRGSCACRRQHRRQAWQAPRDRDRLARFASAAEYASPGPQQEAAPFPRARVATFPGAAEWCTRRARSGALSWRRSGRRRPCAASGYVSCRRRRPTPPRPQAPRPPPTPGGDRPRPGVPFQQGLPRSQRRDGTRWLGRGFPGCGVWGVGSRGRWRRRVGRGRRAWAERSGREGPAQDSREAYRSTDSSTPFGLSGVTDLVRLGSSGGLWTGRSVRACAVGRSRVPLRRWRGWRGGVPGTGGAG